MSTPATNGLAAIQPQLTERGILPAQWRTLSNSLYPGAKPESVLMVWDYCLSRRLDPMKKPCHIVPLEVKIGNTYEWRDVVMPGIYELRTTAQRTGEYLGHSKAVYGPSTKQAGVEAPEWCEMIAYRWNATAKMRAEYPVMVFFREVVATKRDGMANSRWSKAPIQMMTKCAEAAAIREAFPDEVGGEQTAEEMDGQRAAEPIVSTKPELPKPEGYDDWLDDMGSVADEHDEAKLKKSWEQSHKDFRKYLTVTAPETWNALKEKAAQVTTDGEVIEQEVTA